MNRRAAVTLIEVLMAIVILGLGLMALLSLFLLGAAQMAQALKDQRAAECAGIAGAQFRTVWKQACDVDANSPRKFWDSSADTPRSPQRFIMALDDPNLDDSTLVPPLVSSAAEGPNLNKPNPQLPDMIPRPVTGQAAAAPSYPVFLDPIGWQQPWANPSQRWWLPRLQQPTNNGNKLGAIPRRPLYVRDPTAPNPWVQLGPGGPVGSPFTSFQRLLSQVTLLDDVSFNYNGTPDLDNNPSTLNDSSKLPVERQGRYSWAFLVRRPRNDDGNRAQANVSVVVYSGRSVDVPTNEAAYLANVVQTSPGVLDPTQITLTYAAGSKPAVRSGGWVLDATLFDANGNVAPLGDFYRVVNVDDGAAGQVTMELQTPLTTGPAQRVIVVLDNVVEVFPKGECRPDSLPSPF
jgi:type II secretory pathway pseudopilin PulG